ncbi:hypothetical protein Efla_000489 [Eimeria flavescens]
MIRSPLRPAGGEHRQQPHALLPPQQSLLSHQKPLPQQQQQQQQQQQRQQQQQQKQRDLENRLSDSYDFFPVSRRVAASAASDDALAGPACAAAASSGSSRSSICLIGQEMLQRLQADCEETGRLARARAADFAAFIDEKMAELEELATESASLKAQVEDLNAKTQQNLREVEERQRHVVLRSRAVDAELARVAAAKEKVELRLKAAERKLHAARRGKRLSFPLRMLLGLLEFAVVSRQDEHARREWRTRVGLYRFTHGLKITQTPGRMLCCSSSSSSKSSNSSSSNSSSSSSGNGRAPAVAAAAAAAVAAVAAAATRLCFLGLYEELPDLECSLDVLLEGENCRVMGAWPEAPLSELAALYGEGRVTFAALMAYSRLLFKRQLTKMSHTQKLVSLHEQQRQRAEGDRLMKEASAAADRHKEALLRQA